MTSTELINLDRSSSSCKISNLLNCVNKLTREEAIKILKEMKVKEEIKGSDKPLPLPLITNNEELLEYLKKNLDININLDLHLKNGNGNGLTLKFKKDLRDIKNEAATTIQTATRRNIGNKIAKVLKLIKPQIVKGRFREFTVEPKLTKKQLTKEQNKLLDLNVGRGKKRKSIKRKSTKRKFTKRKSTKRKSTKRKSTKK